MILPPWAGEGSIPDADVTAVASAEREGWAALRSLQGDPVVDIIRYTASGGDKVRGVAPVRSLVAGLSGLPALISNLSQQEARAYNVTYADGDRRVELFTDVELFRTDLIRVPGTTGSVYTVSGTYYDPNIGQSIAYIRLAQQGGG